MYLYKFIALRKNKKNVFLKGIFTRKNLEIRKGKIKTKIITIIPIFKVNSNKKNKFA